MDIPKHDVLDKAQWRKQIHVATPVDWDLRGGSSKSLVGSNSTSIHLIGDYSMPGFSCMIDHSSCGENCVSGESSNCKNCNWYDCANVFPDHEHGFIRVAWWPISDGFLEAVSFMVHNNGGTKNYSSISRYIRCISCIGL